jgi:hypothetical protein
MTKAIYYYLRDGENKPVVTICLILYSKSVYRGVAICSSKDIPNKKEGKKKAFGRAWKAIFQQKNSSPIKRQDSNSVDMAKQYFSSDIVYKSTVNPELTEHEKFLVEKSRAK